MLFVIIRQYERGVKFRLGRYVGTKGPGLALLIPIIDRIQKVDMREQVIDEPPQTAISKDNALVDIDFVVFLQVADAEAAVINIRSYEAAVRNLATTTLRAVIGEMEVEEVLSKRDSINQRLQLKISQTNVRWGLEVSPDGRPDQALRDHGVRGPAAVGDQRRRGEEAGVDPRGRGRARELDPAGGGRSAGGDTAVRGLLDRARPHLRERAPGRFQHDGTAVPGDDEEPRGGRVDEVDHPDGSRLGRKHAERHAGRSRTLRSRRRRRRYGGLGGG